MKVNRDERVPMPLSCDLLGVDDLLLDGAVQGSVPFWARGDF